MERNFLRAMPLVLKHEGGFVNHPKDPGGATNLGVTIGTAKRLGLDVDGDGDTDIIDIKLLKPADAAKVYRAEYWNKVRADDLPAGVDYTVFDFAVNSGPGRAVKYLQAAVGVEQDGLVGPVTLAAAAKANPAALINSLCDARLAFMRGLNTWPTFGKGWSSRVAGVRKEALAMARESPAPKPAIPSKPGVVHVEDNPPAVKPGSAPAQRENLFWRAIWFVLGLIWKKEKAK